MPLSHNQGKRKMNKNSEQSNSEENIVKRLDALISILLNTEINQSPALKKIEYLTKLSFTNDEIAKILSTTKKSVEAQKYKKPKVKKVGKKN